jgi:hypothetical protein
MVKRIVIVISIFLITWFQLSISEIADFSAIFYPSTNIVLCSFSDNGEINLSKAEDEFDTMVFELNYAYGIPSNSSDIIYYYRIKQKVSAKINSQCVFTDRLFFIETDLPPPV